MYLTEILSRCSEIEARVGRLYRLLAARFQSNPQMARLWRELALEEETHADILRRELESYEEEDDSGAFLPEYTARLEHVTKLLEDLERRAPTLSSLDDAMAFAVAVEQAELEDLYDDLVAQGQPAFKLISERLEAALSARPASRIPGLPSKQGRS
jgi:rubrerythrin